MSDERKRNVFRTVLEVAFNILLPYLTYTLVKPAHGDVHALMAAAGPPILGSAIELARSRRIDALSLLVLAGVALSLLAFVGGGDPRLLQLREQLVAAAIGLAFLGSAIIGKPLIYQLARARMKREAPSGVGSFEELRDNPIFRRTMMVMTLLWGAALLAEAALCCALVYTISIRHYLLLSPILGGSTVGALTAWSFWYARRRIRSARAAGDGAGNR